MFLDEPTLAIDGHERAYVTYRGADRPVDAARIAIALAWEYRAYRGGPAVSDGWLGTRSPAARGIRPDA